MSTFPIGFRNVAPFPNAKQNPLPTGEVLASTPLGRDEDGKNLVAYIVRTDEQAPSFQLPNNLANNNFAHKNAQKKLRDAFAEQTTNEQASAPSSLSSKAPSVINTLPAPTPHSSARFIKPDNLLSPLEQAELQQLRARSIAIQSDTTQITDGAEKPLLTTPVYRNGPNGERYVVGVSLPLLEHQEVSQNVTVPSSHLSTRASTAYQKSAYFNAEEYRSTLLNAQT